MKGLLVNVYRYPNADCANNGLSATKDSLILVGPEVDGPFELQPDEDYLVYSKSHLGARATPASLIDSKKWGMFGGNFIYCSDDRFTQLNGGHPIRVFDRVEKRPR